MENYNKDENMETVEAEIVEDEFKAPVLKDAKELATLVNVDDLLNKYSEVPEIDPESEEAGEQYQYVLKGHKELVKARTGIQKLRKQIGDPAFQFHKKCIAIEKEVLARLEPTETKLQTARKLVEDHEQRKIDEARRIEEERIESIKERIKTIENLPMKHFASSSEVIKAEIESVEIPVTEKFDEFTDEALAAYTLTMNNLELAYQTKVQAEQADRIQAENEERLAKEEAEKQAKLQAEREEFEAEKRELERQREEMQAEMRAKQEVIDRQNAEREAEELAKRQEAERKAKEEADKELYEKRFNEAYNAMHNFSVDHLLDEIIEGNIPHVKWEPTDEQ